MRYTFLEWNMLWWDKLRSIIVPPDAEQFADVSFYQAGMDWDRYPARAVILRIGQNVWKDNEFEYNYSEARQRGIAIGGYFFFDGRATPQQQANVILGAMQGKYFDMELFIDWERSYSGASEGLPNVVKLMQLCESIQCKAVGLYSGYYWFISNSNAQANAAQYDYLRFHPLWIAWYAAASMVKVPPPWLTWTHWQFGTPALDWGQATAEIDMNRHNGTRADFTARYLGGVTPPTGGPMTKYKILQSLNMRNAPITGQIILAMPAGTFVWGIRDTANNWIHISRYQLPGQEEKAIDGWCSGGTIYVDEVAETPSTLPDLPVMLTLGDDVTYFKQTVNVTLKAKPS
jgi:GH25 family lysozyme M1 (1,4-beta-N-acetylmuramidase)